MTGALDMRPSRRWRRARLALAVGALLYGPSCTENLPVGPNTFSAHLAILVSHDTLVVGDASDAQAQATDDAGHVIQGLAFAWTSADPTILGVNTPAAASDTLGHAKTFVGRKTGRSVVSLSLPDSRFVVPPATRIETVVVGGVKILSSLDTTLTAVNDTAKAIAAGLVRSNGALVTSASQGVRWTHLGFHAATVGAGDTIRYIAVSNGVDTLIASHDFCLIGAKCADTAIVRVSQQLVLTLSPRAFLSWSFGDSVGPTVTLADRRGNGLAGTSVRFVPVAAADSAIVQVTAPIGIGNPLTGLLAAPKLVAKGNGPARVRVLGIGSDGFSIVSTDSITDAVRQVARRVAVEPLRAIVTASDSIPIRSIARDARGATIADATIGLTPFAITLHGIWAGPTPVTGASVAASITPDLSGDALPANNPLAPQIAPAIDPSLITLLQVDTAKAGLTARAISVEVLDSLARPAFGRWVRFGSSFGIPPDSVQVDGTGFATTTWAARDSAGSYTLTGLRGLPGGGPITLTDSAGRIVVRRSIVVVADVPSATKSTLEIAPTSIATNGPATVTITVRDRFGNLVKNATAADFLPAVVGGGSLGAIACDTGVCTATYTAPAAPGMVTISVSIMGTDIVFSPVTLTIF